MQIEHEMRTLGNQLEGMLILIADDTEAHLNLLASIYKEEGASTIRASDGLSALEKVKNLGSKIDLMVFDVRMPEMDGIELTINVRKIHEMRQTPIILVTAEAIETNQLAHGMEAGANDYLNKPVQEVELIARSRTMLRQKKLFDENLELRRSLELKVVERTVEIEMTRDVALFGFAKLAEYRDPETGGHLERIREYTRVLAQQLLNKGTYRAMIDQKFVMHIYKTSPLHDIGKVGIPDYILLKPGPLTEEEFEIMKTHAVIGGDTLAQVEDRLLGNPIIAMAKEIAWRHHEWWNGKGYPDGLDGENIPLPARIMALADVYDALVSKRVYKEAIEHNKVVEMITEMSGAHFDPVIANAFSEVTDTFMHIQEKFKMHE
ncbi:MAG: two-component system response regulator [bacterium]|nr:MAG: two-component system response regulator [bacterium]